MCCPSGLLSSPQFPGLVPRFTVRRGRIRVGVEPGPADRCRCGLRSPLPCRSRALPPFCVVRRRHGYGWPWSCRRRRPPRTRCSLPVPTDARHSGGVSWLMSAAHGGRADRAVVIVIAAQLAQLVGAVLVAARRLVTGRYAQRRSAPRIAGSVVGADSVADWRRRCPGPPGMVAVSSVVDPRAWPEASARTRSCLKGFELHHVFQRIDLR